MPCILQRCRIVDTLLSERGTTFLRFFSKWGITGFERDEATFTEMLVLLSRLRQVAVFYINSSAGYGLPHLPDDDIEQVTYLRHNAALKTTSPALDRKYEP